VSLVRVQSRLPNKIRSAGRSRGVIGNGDPFLLSAICKTLLIPPQNASSASSLPTRPRAEAGSRGTLGVFPVKSASPLFEVLDERLDVAAAEQMGHCANLRLGPLPPGGLFKDLASRFIETPADVLGRVASDDGVGRDVFCYH